MMEHVRHFDWCTSAHERYFVDEADLDNCNTEKILRNKFVDPLLSSDSEDDETHNEINWDEIFNNKNYNKSKLFVPCLRPFPPYPKLSALNSDQHIQFLKVLAARNPNVLEDLFIGKPMRQDIKAFEGAKEIYLKEQKEYQDWAKSLWTTDHCIRALRPKPAVETVYEAEFKIKAQRMRALPKQYDIAAQIPLECRRSNCEAVLKQELIGVPLEDLPQAQIPYKIEKQFTIIRPCTVPEPCQKHPYQFILPNEKTVSILPITEIHKELAYFALTNDTQFIASENALKCLTQWNRHWMIPLSVCNTIGTDGDKENVVVLDSEFSVNKESAPMRTYKAFRHLLEFALIPSSERERVLQSSGNTCKGKETSSPKFDASQPSILNNVDMTSDDEEFSLYIDTGEETDLDASKPEDHQQNKRKRLESSNNTGQSEHSSNKDSGYVTRAQTRRISGECMDIGMYSCTCKDTLYERPPRRSYKKWQFKNKATNENHDIIVHCSHKVRNESGEVIMEPIPEYQLDLGASEQSPDALRSIALSLALRKNVSLLNSRVDGSTGDVVSFETESCEDFLTAHAEYHRQAVNCVHAALSQLLGLLPGHYVLMHEPSHGANGLLMSPRCGGSRHKLVLNFDSSQLAEADEAQVVRIPPTITDKLLPYHKYRKILPCAFTPYDYQLAKEPKKPPPSKKKPPPQAIKWPKRKKPRKKNW